MARRPGFTLVELLVCLALLAVLLAGLMPLVGSARSAAMKVVCTSRLRDLTLACNLYRTERGVYPLQDGAQVREPPPGYKAPPVVAALQPPRPTDIDAAFLNNALASYLRFPRLDPRRHGPEDLPTAVQCPTVEDADDEPRQTIVDIAFSRPPALYTGYGYCVRPKDLTLSPATRLLRPERVASASQFERAVVWADDVQWSLPDYAWSFAHAHPRGAPGPRALTYSNASALLGQHRAYSDGSVEWVNGNELVLQARGRDDFAKQEASLSVFDLYFFWF